MRGTLTPARRSCRRATNARRLALCLAAVAAVPLAGCLRGTLPARTLYRLRPLPPPAESAPPVAAPADPALPPLTVEPYATPGVYAGPEIVYRVDDTRYGTYPDREWAVPLGTMLATLTAESLRRQLPGDGGQVQDGARPGARRGLVWRGTVREFEEVDRGGRGRAASVSAAVRLEAQLVRASDDSVLWRGMAEARRAVVPPDAMTAVVDSLAAAAGAAVAELVRGATPTLRAPAVQRAVARGPGGAP